MNCARATHFNQLSFRCIDNKNKGVMSLRTLSCLANIFLLFVLLRISLEWNHKGPQKILVSLGSGLTLKNNTILSSAFKTIKFCFHTFSTMWAWYYYLLLSGADNAAANILDYIKALHAITCCQYIIWTLSNHISVIAVWASLLTAEEFSRKTECVLLQTSKLRVTGLCVGNSRVTGEFPA